MKPSTPKGTRDFGPESLIRRKYIFETIEKVFRSYGYQPIETPAMENLTTLTGKYGEEGDRLLFKVLNNGDFLAKANEEALRDKDSSKLVPSISKRGLRYDLTVPFARFVVMNQHAISFPFKRYQIQPVWRADRPAKGRYQEFYQCDVDVVGSDSLIYEAELAKIYDRVFRNLNLDVTIKLNNRKILAGIAEIAGISDQFTEMTIAIDKLDKIGLDGVQNELENRGISREAIDRIEKILQHKSFDQLKAELSNSEEGLKGLHELETVYEFLNSSQLYNKVEFDVTLARGLNYYTGCIFEVVSNEAEMGSIGGGGRYDDLTAVFGLKNVSGVGISLGAERIYDIMETLGKFPADLKEGPDLLFIGMTEKALLHSFHLADQLRNEHWIIDIYPMVTKMKKAMKYANDRKVRYVAIIGEEELESNSIALKDMESGDQQTYPTENLKDFLKKNL